MSARRKGFLERLSKFPISSLRYIHECHVGSDVAVHSSCLLLLSVLDEVLDIVTIV